MLEFVAILAAAALTTALTAPLCGRLARRLGIVDNPGLRKQHVDAVPYLGGVAVLLGVLAGIAALLALGGGTESLLALPDNRVLAILVGALALFGLGLRDDIKPVRARHKMMVQATVATALWLWGVRFEVVSFGEWGLLDLGVFSLPVTVLWIVAVANAINLIDGLDGLAAGLGAIAACAIACVAQRAGSEPTMTLLVVLAAALVGFLVHNRHPARIFLGDAGSLTIGLLLAACTVTAGPAPGIATSFTFAGPFLALGVPILDMVFAMTRRVVERRGLFSADRNHIHHRLLSLGYSHGKTVAILWAVSAGLTTFGLMLLHAGQTPGHHVSVFAVVLLLQVFFFRAAGAVRIRDSYKGFRDAAARMREARDTSREYDDLELAFRSAASMTDWWRTVELSAARLGFTGLKLALNRRDGSVQVWTWSSSDGHGKTIRSVLPITDRRAGKMLPLEVEVLADSLEMAAQRIATLGKLLDRHSVMALAAKTSAPTEQGGAGSDPVGPPSAPAVGQKA